MKKIYVDADACPVKDEVTKVAVRNKISTYMVCNGGIRPFKNLLIKLIIVSDGADEADKWIFNNVLANDIVVTADIPLAAKCLDKGANVIKHDGHVLTVNNIGNVLATRDLMSDLRSSDPFLKGKNKSFSQIDRGRFLNSLQNLI
ncbi:YaiI/YqxD family protein [Alphaproteobacteria bacterium]|nr:YaiI/YqxD family protein [Alphaproteobacteria bacterium]MDC1086320.1 YaiI/YqxD family protein [Alphaproteobacteria bacterium]